MWKWESRKAITRSDFARREWFRFPATPEMAIGDSVGATGAKNVLTGER